MVTTKRGRVIAGALWLAVLCGGCAAHRAPNVETSTVPTRTRSAGGLYAVRICPPAAACDVGSPTEGNVAVGRIVILDSAVRAQDISNERMLWHCASCSPTTLVQACFAFTRARRDTTRMGPYAVGVSTLERPPGTDSLLLSLGATDDAGYVAMVSVRGDSLLGQATSWGGPRQPAHFITRDGHLVLRAPTAEERAREAYPMDVLVGERVGPADEHTCRSLMGGQGEHIGYALGESSTARRRGL